MLTLILLASGAGTAYVLEKPAIRTKVKATVANAVEEFKDLIRSL